MPRDDVQDVVSETFIVAWRRRDELRGDPLPWQFLQTVQGSTAREPGDHNDTGSTDGDAPPAAAGGGRDDLA